MVPVRAPIRYPFPMATDLIPLDAFEFHHRLAATPGVSVVIFTSESCQSCRAWKQLLRTTPLAAHVFEVDAERDAALTREFGIFHLPALYLYRDGEFHVALDCAAEPAALHRTIESGLAQPPQDPP
jgi:predicted thioredoxin/glutaredoxin